MIVADGREAGVDTMCTKWHTGTMKAKDAGPMEGYQDWKIRDVPVGLARRLKAAIAADGLSLRGWWIEAAERTAAAYEARIAKGGKP